MVDVCIDLGLFCLQPTQSLGYNLDEWRFFQFDEYPSDVTVEHFFFRAFPRLIVERRIRSVLQQTTDHSAVSIEGSCMQNCVSVTLEHIEFGAFLDGDLTLSGPWYRGCTTYLPCRRKVLLTYKC